MEPLGTGGHSTIGFHVFWQIKRGPSKSRIFSLRRANFKNMRSNLSNADWEKFLDCKSVNEKCGIKRVILDAQCKLIPKVQASRLL